MKSCSKRRIPSQTAASTSPWVFMPTSNGPGSSTALLIIPIAVILKYSSELANAEAMSFDRIGFRSTAKVASIVKCQRIFRMLLANDTKVAYTSGEVLGRLDEQ